MSLEEVKDIAVEWAAKEGWNPGLNDTQCFYKADSKGFFVGLLDEKPISCISAIKYGEDFGFIGFYIVDTEYRGKGYGIRIWNEAMDYLNGRNIALDGVIEQQNNYKKSGFKLVYSNIRFELKTKKYDNKAHEIQPITKDIFSSILEYDLRYFPANRSEFLKCWLNMPESYGFYFTDSDEILGYSIVRKCRTGYKIGPLFAENKEIANQLFVKINNSLPVDELLYLDIPEVNQSALELARKYNMEKVFGTARMYTQKEPNIDNTKVYGVTTFELG